MYDTSAAVYCALIRVSVPQLTSILGPRTRLDFSAEGLVLRRDIHFGERACLGFIDDLQYSS